MEFDQEGDNSGFDIIREDDIGFNLPEPEKGRGDSQSIGEVTVGDFYRFDRELLKFVSRLFHLFRED